MKTENGIFGSFRMSVNKAEKVKLKVTKFNVKSNTKNKDEIPSVSVGDVAMDGAYKGIQQSMSELDQNNKTPGNIELGSAPYYTGWIQYFKWSSLKSNLKKPSQFYKNMEFLQQKKLAFGKSPAPDFKKKDAAGQYEMIPDETHFYVTLFERTLNIANSKENAYIQNYDMLEVANIQQVAEDSYLGGIEDYGNFNEGFCFRANLKEGDFSIWTICTDSLETKKTLMNKIKSIKVKQQRDEGLIISNGNIKKAPRPEDQFKNDKIMLEARKMRISREAEMKNPSDGYWVTIQDWCNCSQKCGGGETVLQRMCVPPRGGGKQCTGKPIIRMKCNPEPCPRVSKYGMVDGNINNRNSTEVLKPVVKVLEFSSRPQRYQKCIIKEGDLLYSIWVGDKEVDENGKTKPQKVTIPVRAVMNNKTFAVYGGEDYSTLKESFSMESSTFVASKESETCFIIRNNVKKAQFCFFGSERTVEHFNEWDYDFNLFKYQCKTRRPQTNATIDENALDDKVKNLKEGMLMDREIDLIKRGKEAEVEDKSMELMKKNKLAFMAVQKQINVDALVVKEEKEKESNELETLEKNIQTEKDKHDCAMKKIKEKEIESQYNLRAEEMEEENDELTKEAKNEILITRDKLKEKIRKMRKATERKKSDLKTKLMSLRTKFNSDVTSAYKKGNNNHCEAVVATKETYNNYCMTSFPNNPVAYGQCTYSDNPCITCCENEFSEVYYSDRIKCIKEICKKKTKKYGKWIWENDVSTIN